MCFVDLSVTFVCLCFDAEKMSLVENPLVNDSKTRTFSHKVQIFNCISHLFSQQLKFFLNCYFFQFYSRRWHAID